MTVGEVVAKLKLDVTDFRSGLSRANRLLEEHREGALKISAALATAGGALGAGLALSTARAVEFESEMRNVNSILKQGEEGFRSLSKSVLAMAGKTGQAPAVLARGLYDIASSGFEGADGLKILEASAIGATAGLTDTATAARAVTGVLNAYGKSADEAAHIQDVLFKGVERGVFTYGDLAQNLGEVVATASQANIPLEEIVATLATITKAGVQPAEAFTSLNRAILGIISPSAQAKAAAAELGIDLSAAALASKGFVGIMAEVGEKLGVSAEEMEALADPAATDAEVMEALAKASGQSVEQLTALFPEIRAFKAVAIASADGTRVLTEELTQMHNAAGAAGSAFAEQSKSFKIQWEKAKATLTDAAITIGEDLLPSVKALADRLGDVAKRFKETQEASKGWGGAIAIGGAASLVTAGSLGILATSLGSVVRALAALGVAGSAPLAALAAVPLVVGAAVGAYVRWAQAQAKAAEETKKNRDELRDLMPLAERAIELAGKQKLTASETEELGKAMDRLRDRFPELLRHYNAEIRSAEALTDVLRELKKARLEADPAYAGEQRRKEALKKDLAQAEKDEAALRARYERIPEDLRKIISETIDRSIKLTKEAQETPAGIVRGYEDAVAAVKKLRDELAKLGEDATEKKPTKDPAANMAATENEIKARVKAWMEELNSLYQAGAIGAGEYIDQLERISAAIARFEEERKAAGQKPLEGLAAMRVSVERQAYSELTRLRDNLRDKEAELHQERLQWTEEEKQARAAMYRHEHKLLELGRDYAKDALKIAGKDTEAALGRVDLEYLDALEKAKPMEGLPPAIQAQLDQLNKQLEAYHTGQLPLPSGDVMKGLLEQQKKLQGQIVTPDPAELAMWADSYRAAIMAAFKEGAISKENALQRLSVAREAAIKAEVLSGEAERRRFEERRRKHDDTMKMLADEEASLSTYAERATTALGEIFKGIEDSSKALQKELSKAVDPVSGWGRITTTETPAGASTRVTNLYYEGKQQAPNPRIQELMDQIAVELDREHRSPRN